MMNATHILMVALGGALGALSRYGIANFANRVLGPEFAWGTLGANLLGCLLIGIGLALAEDSNLLGVPERLLFMTGFVGALTTFSTYAMESIQFMRSGAINLVVLNVLVNNAMGFVLVMVGIWLGRRV